jgi:hypothetical protein
MAEGDAYGVRSPVQAAKDLKNQKGVSLGSKANPSPFVQAAQSDMGGGLTADGIFGPKTRARMTSLLSASSSAGASPAPNIAAAALVAPPSPALAVQPPPPPPEPETIIQAFAPPPPPPPEPVYEAPTVYPDAVTDAVASIPTPARAAMADALQTFAQQPAGTMGDYNALIDAMSAKFGPIIKSISDEVSLQQAQRQATSEHNALMRDDERQAKTNDVLQQIVNKFAELQKVLLANDAVSRRVYNVYGVHL